MARVFGALLMLGGGLLGIGALGVAGFFGWGLLISAERPDGGVGYFIAVLAVSMVVFLPSAAVFVLGVWLWRRKPAP